VTRPPLAVPAAARAVLHEVFFVLDALIARWREFLKPTGCRGTTGPGVAGRRLVAHRLDAEVIEVGDSVVVPEVEEEVDDTRGPHSRTVRALGFVAGAVPQAVFWFTTSRTRVSRHPGMMSREIPDSATASSEPAVYDIYPFTDHRDGGREPSCP
jgi:hypothetical protein